MGSGKYGYVSIFLKGTKKEKFARIWEENIPRKRFCSRNPLRVLTESKEARWVKQTDRGAVERG